MHTLTVFDGTTKYSLPFDGTPTVQQVLEHAGIAMPHPCGGVGICGKCAIEAIGSTSLPDDAELAAGHRLSCRTSLYGDAIVTLKQPSFSATSPLIAEGYSDCIAPSNHPEASIGAAVDIGTTTIALSVYDLLTGHCLAATSARNPQGAVSADVMGRIDSAINGRLSELQHMITASIRTLAENTGYFDRIDKWILTGNTTMLYLLTGRLPKSLATAPYTADHLFGEALTLFDKPAYLPHCLHAFVGADITCAVLASGMCDTPKTSLLCDIGTNGELALWKNGTLYVTSTAAGPVFEGAGISCGCQSVNGAVEAVTRHDDTFFLKTIGNTKPVGICGSGIIDAVACFLETGLLDETGAMEEDAIDLCEEISIAREDIRNIQLAKAAIAAGIKTLLEVTGTTEDEISTFYLAGGFGKHLNLDSAVRIGLFPAGFKNKVKVLGNAALQGAANILADEKLKEKAAFLSAHAEYVILGGMQTFNDCYLEELNFLKMK